MNDELLASISDEISSWSETEALLLAGSRTGGTVDRFSDTDLYVYTRAEIDPSRRVELAGKLCSRAEIDNRFWETEDLWQLKDGLGKVELIFRDYDFIRGELERICRRHQAYIGYSTCMAANFFSSRILFDRNGRFLSLREEFDGEYPEELIQNIIDANFPLLSDSLSSYRGQIEVAAARGDIVSVNHRVGAFLASYFDILFACNRMWHPGEKKLLTILENQRLDAPQGCKRAVEKLLFMAGTADSQLPVAIELMTSHMGQWIESLGWKLPVTGMAFADPPDSGKTLGLGGGSGEQG